MTRAARAALLRGIYVIANEGEPDPSAIVRGALSAGVRVVQYRAKRGIVVERLRELRRLTRECGALLLLDDDARAAVEFDCDGVHLGPDDRGFANVAPIRAALGSRLIGLSCGTPAEARAATSDVDYIGAGAVYATASKDDAGDPIGVAGLQRVAGATTLPVAAIGGIGAGNLDAVARTGVAMAAVISAVANDPDPAAAAARLVRIWNEASPA
ncbi:MAG TPA: thiamine phosphate synthase [Candidatus Tumulicola sp.]